MRSVMANLLAVLTAMAPGATGATDTPLPADPRLVSAGGAIYQRSCASCHGAHGEGVHAWQRPDAHGELPAPPHGSTGHTWKHSDAMLYRIVQLGWRDAFNKTERLTMPPFNGQLSREETIAVITYLKTLWTPKQRQFQAEESRGHPFPTEAP
jgi:mono/diheme cytochrome c family protein